MLDAVDACQPGHPRRTALLVRAAGALAAGGPAYQPEASDRGIILLGEALPAAGHLIFGERSRCLHALGRALVIRFDRMGAAADLELAISSLEQARTSLEQTLGDPLVVPLLRTLALAYRLASQGQPGSPRRDSRAAARSVLHAHARAVLLQSTPAEGLSAARRIGADTLRLAAWCLADGLPDSAVEALELGRGLVLHAATVTADVPALLTEAGHQDLARAWISATTADPATTAGSTGHVSPGPAEVPANLRHRVLSALSGGAAERRLFSAPQVSQIAATLRAGAMDALVYLVPESGELTGRALIVSSTGTVSDCALPELSAGPGSAIARYAAARLELGERPADLNGAIGELCEWAWASAIGPVLRRLGTETLLKPDLPRLAIAPIGALGVVPWHAAHQRGPADTFSYACRFAIFSTCASARQLIDTTARTPVPANGPVVLVAGLGKGLRWSRLEADALCTAFYPRAVYLGTSFQTEVQGSGTAAEVLAWLPGGRPAAVLQLGCHARTGESPEQSALYLASRDGRPEQLSASRILARSPGAGAPGGLVVLAACASDLSEADHDEALTLATAFLAAGARNVVGSRWAVGDRCTALLMFMLHYHLVRHPADGVAVALRAAQLWMLDPQRRPPPEMPPRLARETSEAELADVSVWAAFTHAGG